MFPTDSIDPNEWQLQLVKKDNTQILPIFDDLCSLDKVNKCTEDAGKVAVESRQKEKKMKKVKLNIHRFLFSYIPTDHLIWIPNMMA